MKWTFQGQLRPTSCRERTSPPPLSLFLPQDPLSLAALLVPRRGERSKRCRTALGTSARPTKAGPTDVLQLACLGLSRFDIFAVFPILRGETEGEMEKKNNHASTSVLITVVRPRSAIIFTFRGGVLLSTEVKMVALCASK